MIGLLLLLVFEFQLLIKLSFGGCFTGTTDADDRRLGIEINDDVSWAGSDGKIFANIYANNGWNGWRRLDNANCDDFVFGAVDYFDDFENITDDWEGIGIYLCNDNSDGLLIESLYYWDGTEERALQGWQPGVFGPFPDKCLYSDATNADSQDEPGTWYSDILIDGDTEGCDGVVFQTSGNTGKVWTGTLPGRPDCDQTEYGANRPVYNNRHTYNHGPVTTTTTSSIFEQQLLNYLMIVIGIALLLFISNSCLITAIVKNNYANKVYDYGKSVI